MDPNGSFSLYSGDALRVKRLGGELCREKKRYYFFFFLAAFFLGAAFLAAAFFFFLATVRPPKKMLARSVSVTSKSLDCSEPVLPEQKNQSPLSRRNECFAKRKL